MAGRAHPFTAGAVALSLVALAVLLPSTPQVVALCLVAMVLGMVSGARRGVGRALIAVAPVWVLLFVMQGIFGPGDRVVAPWGGTLSQPGLAWMVSQGTRLTAITTASLTFADQFNSHRFLQAVIGRGWSFNAAFLLVATLDAAARLAEQARRLREAQRTRGVRVTGSLVTRVRAVPALVFPLLITSLTDADDRALALETRGLTIQGRRTATDPPPDTVLDRAVRWLALAMVIAGGVLRVRGR